MGSIVLLDLMGVSPCCCGGCTWCSSGVLRAFGADLRRFLGNALGNRFQRFGAGLGMYRTPSKQHGNRIDDDVSLGRRPCQARAGTCDHAGRQCRHHPDRSGFQFDVSMVAPVRSLIGLVVIQEQPAPGFPRPRPGCDRSWTYAVALHILLDTLAPAEFAPCVRAFSPP